MKTKHLILLISSVALLTTLPVTSSAQRRPLLHKQKQSKTDIPGKITMFYGEYLVSSNGKKGITSTSGRVIIPVQYDKIEMYYGEFRVVDNGKYGLFTSSGREIIPAKYDKIEMYYGNFRATCNSVQEIFSTSGRRIASTEL